MFGAAKFLLFLLFLRDIEASAQPNTIHYSLFTIH